MKFLKISLGIMMFLAFSFLTRPGQNFVLGAGIACTIGSVPGHCQFEVENAIDDLKKGHIF